MRCGARTEMKASGVPGGRGGSFPNDERQLPDERRFPDERHSGSGGALAVDDDERR